MKRHEAQHNGQDAEDNEERPAQERRIHLVPPFKGRMTAKGIELDPRLQHTISSRTFWVAFRRNEGLSVDGESTPPRVFISPIQPDDYPFAASLTVRIQHRPGTLSRALHAIAALGINVIQVEQRRNLNHYTFELLLVFQPLKERLRDWLVAAEDQDSRDKLGVKIAGELEYELKNLCATLHQSNQEVSYLYAQGNHRPVEADPLTRLCQSWPFLLKSPALELEWPEKGSLIEPKDPALYAREFARVFGPYGLRLPAAVRFYSYPEEDHLELDIKQTEQSLTSGDLDVYTELELWDCSMGHESSDGELPTETERSAERATQPADSAAAGHAPPRDWIRSAPGGPLARGARVKVVFANEDDFATATSRLLYEVPEARFHMWGNNTITTSNDVVDWFLRWGYENLKLVNLERERRSQDDGKSR